MKMNKHNILSSLATFSAVIGSLAIVCFWIRGTIRIVFGGQDLFATIVWTLFITCILYFMSLLTAKALIASNAPHSRKAAVLFINVAAVALACYSFAMSINLTVSIIVGILSVIGFITGFRIDFDEVSAKSHKYQLKVKSFDLD